MLCPNFMYPQGPLDSFCLLPVSPGPLRSAYDLLTACHDLLESALRSASELQEQLGAQEQVKERLLFFPPTRTKEWRMKC